MAKFVVTYWPRNGVNFGPIMDELTRMGGVEIRPGTWLLEQEATVADIFGVLDRAMPTTFDDPLFVARTAERPRVANLGPEVEAWLNANF
jgi:hypothetical protein